MRAVYLSIITGVLLFVLLRRAQESDATKDAVSTNFRSNLRRRADVVIRYWNVGGTSHGNVDSASPPTRSPGNSARPPSSPGNSQVVTRYYPGIRAPPSPIPVTASPPTRSPTQLRTAGNCEEEVTFETSILVGLTGRPDSVTTQEIDVLEQAFIDSYANAECGDRDIEEVIVVTDMDADSLRQRSLQASSNNRDFKYIFKASIRCRGCSANSRLFGGSSVRRELEPNHFGTYDDEVRPAHHRLDDSINSDSVEEESCPCDAPTEDDFLLSFNSTIRSLVSDGDLINIVSANDVSELEEVNCVSDETDFDTTVSISFAGDGTEPSQAELEALGSAFVDSYNEGNSLNGDTCDLLFRVATEAELISTNGSENRNRELQSNGQYAYSVRVRGSCRGCPGNTRLYGESQGRKLLTSTQKGLPQFMKYGNRNLQILADDCLCPVDDPELRAPTEEEFQIVYDDLIQFLRAEGEITSVSTVVDIADRGSTTAPTLMPPTSAPSSTPTAPPPGRTGSSNGDPHIKTFDGLSYDCQGRGEFSLFKTLNDPSFEVQVRYGGNPDDSRVSVGKGYVIVSEDAPTIQLSIPVNDPPDNVTQLGSCPVLLYADGILTDFGIGSGQDDKVSIQVSGSEVVLTWLSTGIRLSIRSWTSSFFGCALSVIAFVPESFSNTRAIVGLLGTPNGKFDDDWTNRTGEALAVPTDQSQRLYQNAYDYCTTNWCLRDAADSFFTYEEGSGFGDFNGCDDPFTSGVRLDTASVELTALCGTNEPCLIDGLIGGTDDAENALEEQAAVTNASVLNRFRFAPASIQVGFSYNVAITVDLGDVSPPPSTIQAFAIYRLDSNSLQVGSVPVTGLQDIGSGIGEDTVADDSVFSNIIAVRSSVAGESFGFRAIPFINGTEDPASEYVFSSLNAVQSYSVESGIGEEGGEQNQNGTIVEDSIMGLVLVIQYTWPADQRDLDTGTSFLNATVGFSCGIGNQYISFSGDDTSLGGEETIRVLLGDSYADNQWNDAVSIFMAAGWFNNRGIGPASVSIYTEKVVNGITVTSEAVSIVIDPGNQSGCSTTEVGEVAVTVDDDVNIMLIPR